MDEQLAISIQQSPRDGSDYPFIEGGDELKPVILDVAIQHGPTAALPLRIVTANWLNNPADTTTAYRLVIKDRDDVTIFDTHDATQITSHHWGTFYVTITWVNALEQLLRVTFGLANYATMPGTLENLDAVLDPRTYIPVLRGVQRMLVFDRGTAAAAISGSDQLRIRQGYNTAYTLQPPSRRTGSGDRLRTITTLSALPLQGLGQYPGCGDQNDPFVRSLNQKPPVDEGSFLLSADSCFRVEPNIIFNEANNATLLHGSLKLYDDCEACCDCEDYLRPYFAIQRAKRRAEPLAEQLNALRLRYIQAKERLESALQCLLGSVLRLEVTVNQECQILVNAGMFNGASNTVYGRSIDIWFTEWTDDTKTEMTLADLNYVPATGLLQEQHKTSRNVYLAKQENGAVRFTLDCVPSGETHMVSFRVGLLGNRDIRVCAGFVGEDADKYICSWVSTLCTFGPRT